MLIGIQHIYCHPAYIAYCPTYIVMLPNIYTYVSEFTCRPTDIPGYMLDDISDTIYMLENRYICWGTVLPNIYMVLPNIYMGPKMSSNSVVQQIYGTYILPYICWVTCVYVLGIYVGEYLYMLGDIFDIYVGYICWVTYIYVGLQTLFSEFIDVHHN